MTVYQMSITPKNMPMLQKNFNNLRGGFGFNSRVHQVKSGSVVIEHEIAMVRSLGRPLRQAVDTE